MALNPEEFRLRRQQKQQRRQKGRKRTQILLLIAGAVLALALIFVLVFALPKILKRSKSHNAVNPEDLITIRLTAAGNLNVTKDVVAAGGEDYDYTDTFVDVAPLLADADLSVLNFEGILQGAPYGGEEASAPQQLADAIAEAGVDLVQLANSCSMNGGQLGLSASINAIRNAGMEPLGVYSDQTAAKAGRGFTMVQVQGIRIAFVAFTKGMVSADGSASLLHHNEGCVNLLYEDYSTTYQIVDTQGITKILDAVEKEKPDLTVAMVHWGSLESDIISSSQKKICALMQEKGVDAIIGTHPHYVQQVSFDPEAGTLVAYSLGEFLLGTNEDGTEYSILLNLTITKNKKTGEVKITGFDYTPTFTIAEKDQPLRVVRIKEAMAAYEEGFIDRVSPEIYDDMAYALERIEARVKGE